MSLDPGPGVDAAQSQVSVGSGDVVRLLPQPRHVAVNTPSRRPVLLVALLVAAVLAGLLCGVAAGRGHGPWAGTLAGRWARPALPADAARAPLAVPLAAPSGSGGYRFLELEDDGSGTPVRWDPCRPIHYVIRPDGAPPGGLAAVRSAIARLEQVTGLRFTSDGTTDEAPRTGRPSMDRARYGDRWSPVLIAFTDPTEFPSMAGFAGLGGPESIGGNDPGERRYVTGVVLLNRENLAQIATWDDGSARVEAVVRHEFGHLAGLDHENDDDSLMNPRPDGTPADYAPGDLRGLAKLSGGPCFRDY
ncbi:matrixin family metalloprotease [Spongisporangium articulatum]|uniref:Matrixin family metalloprotease n=1 Tax=Spongisporangium articulatum TaxID=3362603 RepID=A0ABW8AMG3_9ACTN